MNSSQVHLGPDTQAVPGRGAWTGTTAPGPPRPRPRRSGIVGPADPSGAQLPEPEAAGICMCLGKRIEGMREGVREVRE